MPPAKSRLQDDQRDAPREKTSGSAKMRRLASQNSNNSHARDAPTSAPMQGVSAIAAAAAAATPRDTAPTLQWPTFDRRVLHAYTREHGLDCLPCFSDPYQQLVLSNPRSIGLYSPTMASRRRKARRQEKEELARTVRRHFNGVGVQENDVIVDFIAKLQSDVSPTARQDAWDRQVGLVA